MSRGAIDSLATDGDRPSAAATLPEAFWEVVERHADRPALRAEVTGQWWTWSEYGDRVRRAAGALAALGVRRGSVVALMLTNRPEFHVLDAATLSLGGLTFSIYNTNPATTVRELLADSGARVVVTEAALAPAVAAAVHDDGGPKAYSVDGGDLLPSWEEALDGGVEVDLEATRAAVSPDDVAALIYTSGTTGPAKGVQITHRNVLWEAQAIARWIGGDGPGESAISYLPMAHIGERVVSHYLPMVYGWAVTCCADTRTIGQALAAAPPSIFFAPPRFFDKIRSSLLAGPLADETSPLRQALERRIAELRAAGAGDRSGNRIPPPALAPLRAELGFDRLRCAMVSAAPPPPNLIEFFQGMGVPLVEGYGLSEATGGVTIDLPHAPRPGCVGPPLPGSEVRIAEDGEIQVRGPNVMAGYRNRPDLTREVMTADGWLRTGDIGALTDDGRLRVVDRMKELIINAAGKNMSPINIEFAVRYETGLVGHVLCVGDGRPYNVALITLDPAAVTGGTAEAAMDGSLLAQVREAVQRANARLNRAEQIKRFLVLPTEWQPASDELTPTMKVRRREINRKYAREIDALYRREIGTEVG
jgi:long-chain acyl-CoA synthetase